jgi:hypothetical protein
MLKGTVPSMREPLKLADQTTIAALQAHYAISITTLTFLPLGDDSASAAYRVRTTDGANLFLKVRADEGFSVPSLVIPYTLYNQGVPHILAPLPTIAQTLWVGNVLLDRDQQLWIVDWDETILALKERDLMFVVGGIGRDLVSPHETTCFSQGYGDTTIDPHALVYYRYAWAVQDMAAYGERVFFSPNLGEETRRDALRGFMNMFEPGNIVAIAFESDSIASQVHANCDRNFGCPTG